jgi:hypothetical protein
MKRFWLVLLSLGLIAAFSTQAMAVDVKVSGEYYAAGMYLDKTRVNKNFDSYSSQYEGPSTAFYYQRLRVRTDFVVSQGLALITRFDAMERAWGAARSSVTSSSHSYDSAGTDAENENIAFDWVYLNYAAPVGVFNVGYMNAGATGTVFGNNSAPAARIKYAYTIGAFTMNANYTKAKENSVIGGRPSQNKTDADSDVYQLEGVYKFKSGVAGLSVNYYNDATNRPPNASYRRTYFLFTPYAIAKLGPVNLQAELNYAGLGKNKYEDNSSTPDRDIDSLAGWVDATADFNKFYVGGSIAYVQGQGDNSSKDNTVTNGGRDWSPCLIMWNYERTNWAGSLTGYDGANQDTRMSNGWLFQFRGGVRPVEKLDIMASVTYAFADKKPTISKNYYTNDEYGYEIDVAGTYKITNNLSYMLGAGYLMTGKYYKGINSGNTNDVRDDFLVINKLTLTF